MACVVPLTISRVIAMTVRMLIAAVLVLASPFALAAQTDDEKERVIDLGGPRQARAILTVAEGEYRVRVRLLPVRTFDDATNAELNREKGQALALQALARHLSDAKEVHLTVSGARVEAAKMEGRFYALTLRVPRKGVAIARKESPPTAKASASVRVVFDSALFTRKRDYLQTIDLLAASLRSELRSAERSADDGGKSNTFRTAINRVRKRAHDDFDKLSAEVKGDLLLSGVLDEPGELFRAISARQREVDAAINQAVKRQDARRKKRDDS